MTIELEPVGWAYRFVDAPRWTFATEKPTVRGEGFEVRPVFFRSIDTTSPESNTVNSIPDAKLLERAVHAARSRRYNKGAKHPRWVAVKDAFSLGRGFSYELCNRFGVDPEEEVSR